MTLVVGAMVRLLAIVIGSYAIAIALLRFLPDPGTVALGIYAGNTEAIAQFHSVQEAGYLELLGRAMRVDLGLSIDQVPVTELIAGALYASLPQLGIAALLLVVGFVAPILVGRAAQQPALLPRFCSTLPPYLPVMLVVSAMHYFGAPFANPVVAGFAVAVLPLAYLFTVAERLRNDELKATYTLFHAAQGADTRTLRLRILRTVGVHVLPTLQVVAISLLSSQIFVETVANIGGLGALTVRAAKRVDANLILGLVLFYSLVVGTIHVVATAIRGRYPS
jgi:ABC-type dipeptide/oligopeptide/nickel transport system permease component